jgi:ribosomal protein S18 acetylase RimI-like enzyme
MTGSSDVEIRLASVDDAPALARVHVDAWQAAYRGLVPDSFLRRFTYEWRKKRFRQSLAAHAEETYAVEVGGEIVGLLTVGTARDADLDARRTGEIWGIYLAPAYWRRGIGRRLVAEAERMLRSRGYDEAVLWVLADNGQARQFYKAVGFTFDGQSKEIDLGKRLKAVRYAKHLAGEGQRERGTMGPEA